jgi:hypothetical protein
MATQKQIKAAKENIKKAQKEWRSMTPRQHARAQPRRFHGGSFRWRAFEKHLSPLLCLCYKVPSIFVQNTDSTLLTTNERAG